MYLKHFKVTGPVSVEPTTPPELRGQLIAVRILMGPTGSGKSALIESLSSEGTLSISKDCLESVTQAIACYRLVNVMSNCRQHVTCQTVQTILMDTPGFLDTKMSESKISKMVVSELDALRKCAQRVFPSLYYFLPITDIRMGSSKRDAIKFLKAFAESFDAVSIHVVTTMWNTIPSPKRTLDANKRLMALQKDILKKSGHTEIHIHKFDLSRELSLAVIDHHYGSWESSQEYPSESLSPKFQSMALHNLVGRISNTREQLEQFAEDRKVASIPGKENHQLLEVIDQQEPATLAALRSFLDELYELDPSACSSPLPTKASSVSSPANLPSLSLIPPPSSLRSQQPPLPVNIVLPEQVATLVPAHIAPSGLALQASPSPASFHIPMPVRAADILPLPLPQASPLIRADIARPTLALQILSSPVSAPPPVPAAIAPPALAMEVSPSPSPPTTLWSSLKRFLDPVKKLFAPNK